MMDVVRRWPGSVTGQLAPSLCVRFGRADELGRSR